MINKLFGERIKMDNATGETIEMDNASEGGKELMKYGICYALRLLNRETDMDPCPRTILENFAKEKWVDINIVLDDFGTTPLIKLVIEQDYKMVELFLQNGANPNCRRKNGETPLMTAAYNSDVKMINLLLKYGADRLAKNNDGEPVSSYLNEDTCESIPFLWRLLTP